VYVCGLGVGRNIDIGKNSFHIVGQNQRGCLGKRHDFMPITGRKCEIEDAVWQALSM